MTGPGLAFYQGFDWMPVAYAEVRVGDLLANHGSVTRVVVGPNRRSKDKWKHVDAGKILIECGDSFSTKADAGNPTIIGRRKSA